MAAHAEAKWEGSLKEGAGSMKLGAGGQSMPFTFKTRFEGERGSNPEELIGAALAGCYSMALTAELAKAGLNSNSVETTVAVEMGKKDDKPTIVKLTIDTTADVPGADEDKFQQIAQATKQGCPVSRALAAVETNELNARLK